MSQGDIVLEHETRKMIFNHIIEYPGVSFNTLKKVLNITDGTLRYHLAYLERNEKIRFGLEKGRRIYYPHQVAVDPIGHETADHEGLRISQKQYQLLGIIKRYPKITQKELIKRSGMNRFTIMNNLKKLIGLELIKKTPNGNNVYYEFITNEQLQYQILKRLVIKLLKKEITEEKFIELKRKLELE
jgi:predicted transcriptional regulator